MRAIFLFLVLIMSLMTGQAQNLEAFKNPPDEYRPSVIWAWANDLVSKKGITYCLERFQKFGLGGTMIMLVGSETLNRQMWSKHNMPERIVSLTPEFFDAWKFAAEESARLGLTITSQLGTGWNHSGGPWVKPEQAIQHIAFTETETITDQLQTINLILSDSMNHSNDALSYKQTGNTYFLYQPGGKFFTSDIAILAYPDKVVIKKEDIIDLTKKFRNKKLVWKVPPGNWKIKRFAMRDGQVYNWPPPEGGKGLESDKLDKAAVDANFTGLVGRFLQNSPQLIGKTIRGFQADSWEVGNPEWTPKFREEFVKRRGYDPVPWLVTFKSSQIVGNNELTQRFKNDTYTTLTDLFADNFFSHLSQKADSLGMEFLSETYMAPFDPIRMAGRIQVPMCEFWVSTESNYTARWMSSAANTYGKKTVAAEAYTARWSDGNWQMDPYAIKKAGDLAFCNGVNKMILHCSALQPWGGDVKPGMTMYMWGTMFAPAQTWLEPGKAWTRYLSRCQYLLSQGQNVADVVGLMPTVDWWGSLPLGLHKKYNYDQLTEELLIKELDYKNGFFCLPSGSKYRVLFLPKTNSAMKPEVLSKLITLVKKGGTVVCQNKTFKSSSLTNYPQTDKKIKKLADQLWGKTNGTTIKENKLGKGKLIWLQEIWRDEPDPTREYFMNSRIDGKGFFGGQIIQWSPEFLEVLKTLTEPDVEVLAASGTEMAFGGMPQTITGTRTGENAIAWTHRTIDNSDIYFVSSQVGSATNAELLFRVHDKQPFLLDPQTGKVYDIKKWSQEGSRIRVVIPFNPFGSVFVLFKPKGTVLSTEGYYNYANIEQTIPLTHTWDVRFPANLGAPPKLQMNAGSWTSSDLAGVKYFSGTATYDQTIQITDKQLRSNIWLDLGEVKNLAEIIVNNKVVDTLWCPPFKANITGYLTEGPNQITIKITNTWWNRMVGDEQLPEDLTWYPDIISEGNGYRGGYELKEIPRWVWTGEKRPSTERITFTPWRFVEKDSPLIPAGLIGPVNLFLEQKDYRR